MSAPPADPAVPTAGSRLLVPVLVVGLLVGVLVVLTWPAPDAGSGTHAAPRSVATGAPGVRTRSEAAAAAVLGDWDARRARAWARGDAAALALLYAPGASAGAADLALLRAWSARGLVVRGLTTQLLAVRVLGHGPRRWRLLVRDRVAAASAASAASRSRGGGVLPLAGGASAERVVVLRLLDGRWRVASVRPAPRAGPR